MISCMLRYGGTGVVVQLLKSLNLLGMTSWTVSKDENIFGDARQIKIIDVKNFEKFNSTYGRRWFGFSCDCAMIIYSSSLVYGRGRWTSFNSSQQGLSKLRKSPKYDWGELYLLKQF